MNFKRFDTSDNQWHDIPYYIHKTATDTLTLPATLYPNDTSVTVGIKGNTTQSGTPSPSNPVDVNGVGERTENLFDKGNVVVGGIDADGSIAPNDNMRVSGYIRVNSNTVYTATYLTIAYYGRTIAYYDTNKNLISTASNNVQSEDGTATYTITTPNNCYYVRIATNIRVTNHVDDIMFNLGSTALPYEPYGYKIPILNNAVTTNVYLGDVQTTRKIKKCVFRGVLNNDGWYYNSSVGEYDTYRTDVTSDKLFNVNMVLCTHFPNYGPGERIAAYEKALYIYVKRSEIGSLTELIQFLQQQNSNGTPVTVWYVRETPQAAAVNEPLMKIDTYADTLSNATAIPTIEGANSITIDTTVQPSEFTATWTGWHAVEDVHERENGQWD